MTSLALNLLFALIWSVMIGTFTPFNFIVGFVVSYIAMRLAWNRLGNRRDPYFDKFPQVIGFVFFFIKELVVANISMAIITLSPSSKFKPGIVAIPLEPMSDAEITLLANLITLTPGTLSMDVSADRSTLFVHFMDVADPAAARDEIKSGFERRVLEVMR